LADDAARPVRLLERCLDAGPQEDLGRVRLPRLNVEHRVSWSQLIAPALAGCGDRAALVLEWGRPREIAPLDVISGNRHRRQHATAASAISLS